MGIKVIIVHNWKDLLSQTLRKNNVYLGKITFFGPGTINKK